MLDNRNFLLAMVLSMMVLVVWQYYFAQPQIDQARREQAAQTETTDTTDRSVASGTESDAMLPSGGTAPTPGAAGVPAAGGAPSLSREAALTAAPRVPIATPSLSGSVNLVGARIDDLRLTEYRETVDPASPTIVLLSPSNGPNGYFAEFGWIGPTTDVAVPGPSTPWTAPEGARLTPDSPLTLTYDNGAGLLFTRTISVDSQFMFEVTDSVANSGEAALTLTPYGRVTRIGEPASAGWYILHEGPVGVFGENGLEEPSYSNVEDARQMEMPATDRGWLGITDKYWAATLIPAQGKTFNGRFAYFDTAGPVYQADFRGEPVTLGPGATAGSTAHLFAGAKQVSVIDGYETALGIERFELLIDWGWFYFITKPLFYVIDWFFRLLGNFGLAILAVTVVVKAIFFPLANKSYKSMSAMKKLQPEMVAIRERYKDDRVKQQEAMMKLYKDEKVNPVAGCWPILVQIPVFFALYKVLFVTIEMRHAPFFGWIKDLAAPDPTSIFNLFGLLPYSVPDFLLIGIWPLIMGVTMFLQMRLNPPPPDPTQQMIFNWMPVIFTFMLASFPAGLVIYWAWNNSLSILQQYVIMRRQGVEVDLLGNITSAFKRKPKAADSKGDAKS